MRAPRMLLAWNLQQASHLRRLNPNLVHEIIDALTAHIAVLDAAGFIVAVNDAWIRFAQKNGGTSADSYSGWNYLAVCEQPVQRGDETVRDICNAIRAVQRGERSQCSFEYPCNSPETERWFEMRITRSPGEPPYIVIAHEDITQRKKAESAVRKAEQTLRQVNLQLQESLAREQSIARTDELTGVCNRRQFFALAEHELAVSQRYDRPLSIILFDVDRFKRINDTRGHQVGDEVLKHVARLATEHLRAADVLARYGGEEFIIMLPDSTGAQSTVVAERIRKAIANSGLQIANGRVDTTVSAGIAERRRDVDTLGGLVGRADKALYAAKEAGRNRVLVAST